MELATSLRTKAKHINIIGRSRSPYGIVLGPTTGKAILNHLLSIPDGNKIRYWGVDEVKSFEGNSQGEVTRVLTVKRRAFEAQLVILAIGAVPNTEYLEDTPIRLNQQDGAICVNKVTISFGLISSGTVSYIINFLILTIFFSFWKPASKEFMLRVTLLSSRLNTQQREEHLFVIGVLQQTMGKSWHRT